MYNIRKDGTVTNEHGYVKDAKTFIHMFNLHQESKYDKFSVVLNADEYLRNGMRDTFYADVRVWKNARSV